MKRYVNSAEYYGRSGRKIWYVRVGENEYGKTTYEVHYKLNGPATYKSQGFQRYTEYNVPKKVLDFLSKAQYYDKYCAWYLPEDFISE